jgi:hypothetical protein
MFQPKALNDQGQAKAKRIREAFTTCLREVVATNPAGGRELALMRTHLETAAMWAVKAMSAHVENQE